MEAKRHSCKFAGRRRFYAENKYALLLVAIFLLALPIFATANSSVMQSVNTQVHNSLKLPEMDLVLVQGYDVAQVQDDVAETTIPGRPSNAETVSMDAASGSTPVPLGFETPRVKDWTNLDFINPSFEYPNITVHPDGVSPGETPANIGNPPLFWWHSRAQATSLGWQIMHESFVPGWRSIPTNPANMADPRAPFIEIQNAARAQPGAFPHSGTQFAELNAHFAGTLFQDVDTTPGQLVYWELHHRALTGSQDIMDFFLYSVPDRNSNLTPVGGLVNGLPRITRVASGSHAWNRAAGAYTVPAGQTLTRFAFQAVTPTGASGNLLDDIRLFTPSFLEVRKSNNASGTTYALRGEQVTYTIEVENIGEADASRSVLTDVLPDGVDFVPGSITINGSPAGTLGTYDPLTRTVRVNLGTGATAGTNATNGGIIDNGETVTVTFRVVVTANTGELIQNQARVTYDDHTFEHLTDGGFWNVSHVNELEIKGLYLYVTNVTPVGVNVATSTADLVITFNREVNETGPTTRYITLNGQTLDLTAPGVIWTVDSTGPIPVSVLTIPFASTPITTLEYKTSYEVIISGFESLAGGVMTYPHTHRFATEGSAVITKRLLMPEGTTTPNTTFEFTITPHSLMGDTSPQALAYLPDLYDNNTQTIGYTDADIVSVNATGTIVIDRISQSLLTGVEFPFAGIFSYLITETSAGTTQSVDSGTLYFDPNSFIITFEVESIAPFGTGYYVASVHINRANPDGSLGQKIDGPLTFINAFTRNQEFSISKELQGALANLTRFFDFDVTVTVPYIVRNPLSPMLVHTGYRAYVRDLVTGANVTSSDNGTVLGTAPNQYLLFMSGVEQRISLRHNQELVFVDTHVGTRYDVTEIGVANYQAQVTVTANSITSQEQTGTTGEDFTLSDHLSSSYLLVGEGTNTARFVNISRITPPTGVVAGSFVPAVGVWAIAGVVITASILYGKRRHIALTELKVSPLA